VPSGLWSWLLTRRNFLQDTTDKESYRYEWIKPPVSARWDAIAGLNGQCGMSDGIIYRFNRLTSGSFFMFSHNTETGYRESLPGIRQKTLVFGKNTLMAEFRLHKGSQLPRHTHLHEQTGYLVSGHITLRIGDEESDIRPGDSWNIPGNVEHSATIHRDSVAIEIFYPVREEYLVK